MIEPSDLKMKKLPLNNSAGRMPALGFGTLIPDPAVTISATRGALEAGFRHFDCAERYRNEREVGDALQAGLAATRPCTRRHLRHNKTMEHQSSARARRTCIQCKSRQAQAHLSRPLPHSHSVCISTGRQPGSARSKRQHPLRHRRDVTRHLEGTGKSRRSWPMRRHRTVRHRLEHSRAHLRICANQTVRGPGRIPSISARNGASAVLQGTRHRVSGVCAIGPRHEARARSKIQSSWQSLHESERRPHRYSWLGRCSAAPLC